MLSTEGPRVCNGTDGEQKGEEHMPWTRTSQQGHSGPPSALGGPEESVHVYVLCGEAGSGEKNEPPETSVWGSE